MLDDATEQKLTKLTASVREAFGAELIGLVLYGSAAGPDFVPGQSDLNLALFVDRVTWDHLKRLRQHLPGWHKLGMATPLLIDRDFLARASDVFPAELLDLQAQHRPLFGEDFLASLKLDAHHLRFEAEYEARGKLLRLRAAFVEVGGHRGPLEALVLDSLKTFLILMRHFLRLRSRPVPGSYPDVLDAFEREFGIRLPTFHQLLAVRAGDVSWPNDLDPLFETWLHEVEGLVGVIDRLEVETPAPANGTPLG